jgi:hypothetical protein
MIERRIAALYVEKTGVYSKLPFVDLWDIERDARRYPGPEPIVGHSPCERWGKYWSGGPSAKVRRTLGDDNGCFEAVLSAVRKWGGVIEHPEGSPRLRTFGIKTPPKGGGWVAAGDRIGWTCSVEQGHYGHRARKATWLYACWVTLPSLVWGPSWGKLRLDEGFHSAEERSSKRSLGFMPIERLDKKERLATPIPFRDLLLSIASTVPAL